MLRITQIYTTDNFEIIENPDMKDIFKISKSIPWIWRGLDEHIKVYEQLIKDLKSLQSKK